MFELNGSSAIRTQKIFGLYEPRPPNANIYKILLKYDIRLIRG